MDSICSSDPRHTDVGYRLQAAVVQHIKVTTSAPYPVIGQWLASGSTNGFYDGTRQARAVA